MKTHELTALADAAGVLVNDRHRPPISHISPAAAALAHDEEEVFVPTWRDVGAAVVGIAVFWVLYVTVWVAFGGAA